MTDIAPPGLGRLQPPGSVGADDVGVAIGRDHLELHPESGPLADGVSVAAQTSPSPNGQRVEMGPTRALLRSALQGGSVVVSAYGNRVAAGQQMRGHVVSVVALAPWIAAGGPAAKVDAVDVEQVAVGGGDVELRRRGRAVELERAARVEVAVIGLGLSPQPDEFARLVTDRHDGRRLVGVHRRALMAPSGRTRDQCK